MPAFPLRLALSLCGGDKGRSLSKIPPHQSQLLVIQHTGILVNKNEIIGLFYLILTSPAEIRFLKSPYFSVKDSPSLSSAFFRYPKST
jgi:hypothetical protein